MSMAIHVTLINTLSRSIQLSQPGNHHSHHPTTRRQQNSHTTPLCHDHPPDHLCRCYGYIGLRAMHSYTKAVVQDDAWKMLGPSYPERLFILAVRVYDIYRYRASSSSCYSFLEAADETIDEDRLVRTHVNDNVVGHSHNHKRHLPPSLYGHDRPT